MTYPGKYKCGFAGVPVSDVIMRMGYSTDDYRKIFSDEGHIGKTPREDMAEYKRRSPVWHAEKLQDPLLIHTNTSDDDVNVVEVEHMIRALKAEIRLGIYQFLAKHLKPNKPFKSVKDVRKAAYKFN